MPNRAKQRWDPARYRRNASFVAELGLPVVELLNPLPNERILDLGCGDGTLTAKLRDMGVEIVGVDNSPDQIDAARELGLDARVTNGESLEFDSEFDAVFSNAAMHWMADADAVVEGVWRALKPGGRFVAEMGGFGNVKRIGEALGITLGVYGIDGTSTCPWYFPTVEEQRKRLEKQGFVVRNIMLFDRPTPLPGNIGDWLETFAESYLGELPLALRQTVVAEVAKQLQPVLMDQSGTWIADYVRLRFFAIRAC